MYRVAAIILGALCLSTTGLRYDPDYVQWNLNQNQNAIHPSDYWGEWENHTFKPSPTNWRFPFYTLTLDRFVDGDPSNNNANGTNFEHDWMTNQIRFGGDTRGLLSSLDYLQGMGIKASRCCLALGAGTDRSGHREFTSPEPLSSIDLGMATVMVF
jgi:alpha-1,3-glucan synthase